MFTLQMGKVRIVSVRIVNVVRDLVKDFLVRVTCS
jgi:hypothetical protein